MATDPETVERILETLGPSGVTARKMFGEYGLFRDGRMAALVCDDTLYVKPTDAGRAVAGPLEEGPPYEGAKDCLIVPEDRWEDAAWLTQLVAATAAELPPPKKRKKKPKA